MAHNALTQFAADPVLFAKSLWIPSAQGRQKFGACMADFQEVRFRDKAPALLAVARGEEPPCNRFWDEATKGGSKDSDLAVCVLWLLVFSARRLKMQVGADDRDQANELQDAAEAIIRENEWLGDILVIERYVIKNPKTKSSCEIVAADIRGAHGSRPDVVIINELSHIGKQQFAETMFDNASKIPRCLVMVATNAGFQNTWQWRWRETFRVDPRWKFNIWNRPSPWLSERDIEEASRRNTPSRYKRLWWGVWSSGEGDALTAEDVAGCTVVGAGPHSIAMTGMLYVTGIDLGVSHDHAACVTLAAQPGSGVVELAEVQSWAPRMETGKVDLIGVREGIRATWRRFTPVAFPYDPTQAELMVQDLAMDGLNMVPWPFSTTNCSAMARTLLQVFKNRRIKLYPEDSLKADLHRLSIVERNWGYKLVSASDDAGHADRAIALAIALPIAMEIATSEAGEEDDPNMIELVKAG